MASLRPLGPSPAPSVSPRLAPRSGGESPPPVGLGTPTTRLPANVPSWRAFLSMSFRPFYLLAALYAAGAVLAWVAGYDGSGALTGMYWHAHEMIWGFAGAVIVGFLLTAVASWTGLPALAGAPLAGLVGLWLAARLAADVNFGLPLLPAGLSLAFFLASALALGLPIVKSRNRRNYAVPFLLLGFAATNLFFNLALAGRWAVNPRGLLHAGLVVVAGMAVNLERLARWWKPGVLRDPLLWILFAGYGCAALGVGLAGVAVAVAPGLLSGALHCIAVGGVGVLTLGMMTRTALGNTGRPLKLPRSMEVAYGLMLAATALRLAAALPGTLAGGLLVVSGACFALAFLLFAWVYGPWLIRSRADGLP